MLKMNQLGVDLRGGHFHRVGASGQSKHWREKLQRTTQTLPPERINSLAADHLLLNAFCFTYSFKTTFQKFLVYVIV